ncbi:hypothetical protein ABB37_02040 [Leptomonas pyrrhocoris]|uniref:Uncharacterized protein n=1 Tax=Leptomonas pyrrhocoris TaxID=157538 RepID=A0A0N0VGX2_LEPPY|nr:hypothetical protein ABB37_02040 [Leptomonas pyrrhocoris]KPA83838.1 hypothetical protein ABB37_02040 [Leptomonas pyrrhocoris]|eukprot:XP_015662277.1 hypothetical protein ABB37_02040 [Leptomonas pyrrhocoris]
MDSTPTPTPSTAPAWAEFTHDICEQLNCSKCIVLVGEAALIDPVKQLVDEACRNAAVVKAFTGVAKGGAATEQCCAPTDMPHVTFTSEENQQMAQKCMAVFGRVPFLAVLDMRDDDDEHSFVMDLQGRISADMPATTAAALTKATVEFLIRVGRGSEPRCRQGAAPPPHDVFEPTHGAVLCEGRAAVTSTFPRLIGITQADTATTSGLGSCSTATPTCGALCVFWSYRCPCCPGVLMLIEALVNLIRLVAARHAEHPSGNVSFAFPFVAANIDDNDFTQEEWPVAEREQVVPSLVAYPPPSYKPVVFTGERLPIRLVSFICHHCLPSGELVACTPHIMEEVSSVASKLSIDELMTVMEEGSEGYEAATQAYAAFTRADATAEARESLYASLHDARAAALPFSLEAEVRRMAAEGGAAAAGSLSDAVRESEDGGEEVDEEDDAAELKGGGRAATAVATASATAAPVVTAASSYKRSRE